MRLIYERAACETVRFAGEELLRYLARAAELSPQTFGRLSARYSIALDWDACEASDAFSIDSTEAQCRIHGSNPRSVLLGVYAYLQRLGFRFLAPGGENELIPRLSPEDFAVKLESTASFHHRGVCIEGADSVDNILAFIDWMPKAGFNSFFVQHDNANAFLKRWYEHQFNPTLAAEAVTSEDYDRFNTQITAAMTRRGLMIHRAGHGWTSKVMGTREVCERTALQPSCPQEYLALIGGERGFIGGVPSNTNLCYANEAVIDALTEQVIAYMKAHPETDYLHVWLADEYNNICECEVCSRTTPSDQYIRLLNHIDAALYALGSRAKIALLLYQELLWPPVQARLDHPERFVLVFAPISRTFEKSYQDMDAISPIPPYRRNRITLPNRLEENAAFLKAWQARYTIDSFVYDYPLGRAHYGDLGYVRIARVIARDVQALHGLGLNGYMSCQELRAAFPNNLPDYVLGRMLWDSAADAEGVIREYFSAAYGDMAESAYRYLERLSALSSCDYFNGIGARRNAELSERYAEAARLADAFAPALRQWKPANAVELANQKLLDYHVEYGKLLAEALSALADGQSEQADTRWRRFMSFIRKEEPSHQSVLDVYRVLEVATKYTGFQLDMQR